MTDITTAPRVLRHENILYAVRVFDVPPPKKMIEFVREPPLESRVIRVRWGGRRGVPRVVEMYGCSLRYH